MALQLLLGAQLQTEVDSLPLRRWPCWPGPYSRLLTGDFGRPQMFSPRRRSILYFADSRLLIAFPFKTIHRNLMFRVKGNAPSSGLRFRDLTGFSTHALRKNPRDTSNEYAGRFGPALAAR